MPEMQEGPSGIMAVKHVVRLSSEVARGCDHCHTLLNGMEDLRGGINHYIEEHDYRLLHVGQETQHGDQGAPWHITVAILGATSPPPLLLPLVLRLSNTPHPQRSLESSSPGAEGRRHLGGGAHPGLALDSAPQ
jgi:hypothetical protein